MSLELQDYDFDLPEACIAQTPAEPRDHARLFNYQRETGLRAHRHFYDLPNCLHEGDVLVFNDTRVQPARLYGKIEGMQDYKAELLLLEEVAAGRFQCMVRPGKRFRLGRTVSFKDSPITATVESIEEDGTRILQFSQSSDDIRALMQTQGEMPLPPYIKQACEERERYQTVYAREGSSVAAPTAGLHFTPPLIDKLEKQGVQCEYLRLDVGRGTFIGVNTDKITDHPMHEESYALSEEVAARLNAAKEAGRRIISVGTTSVRVLETSSDASGRLSPGSGSTDIFIYPGYQWKFVDALITNFHVPRSTLIMLVASMVGRETILDLYTEAIREGYRFYSFGDAMLIE